MENPYETPHSEPTLDGVSPVVPKPSQITVFGIMHLLGALVGFGGIIFTKLMSQDPKESILQALQQDKVSPAEFTPESLEALDKAFSLNLYFEIFTVILAALMLTSGLAMLLNARWGIALSNKYSLLSIAGKIISIVLIATITIPEFQAFCDGISGAEEILVKTVCLTFIITSLASPIVMLTYPVAAWIFLTRKTVKDYQKSL